MANPQPAETSTPPTEPVVDPSAETSTTPTEPVVDPSVEVVQTIANIAEWRATHTIPKGHYLQVVGGQWHLIKRDKKVTRKWKK